MWIHGQLLGCLENDSGETEWIEYCSVEGLSIVNKDHVANETYKANQALFACVKGKRRAENLGGNTGFKPVT